MLENPINKLAGFFIQVHEELVGEKIGFLDSANKTIHVSPAIYSLLKTDLDLIKDKLLVVQLDLKGTDFLTWYKIFKNFEDKLNDNNK